MNTILEAFSVYLTLQYIINMDFQNIITRGNINFIDIVQYTYWCFYFIGFL